MTEKIESGDRLAPNDPKNFGVPMNTYLGPTHKATAKAEINIHIRSLIRDFAVR